MVEATSTSAPLIHLCLPSSFLLGRAVPFTTSSSLLWSGLHAVPRRRSIRWRSWSPLPVEVLLPPVRSGPQQKPLHEPAHHHVREIATEILEVHPEENKPLDVNAADRTANGRKCGTRTPQRLGQRGPSSPCLCGSPAASHVTFRSGEASIYNRIMRISLKSNMCAHPWLQAPVQSAVPHGFLMRTMRSRAAPSFCTSRTFFNAVIP